MSKLFESEAFRREAGEKQVVLTDADAAEARRLLKKLLGEEERPGDGPQLASVSSERQQVISDASLLSVARTIYQSRKRRAEHFGAALFSEPAWDMLLALYIYGQRFGHQSVSRLADLVQVPLTTAIRWLDYLESSRLVVRKQSPLDRRKVFISLSDAGRAALDEYFMTLVEGGAIRV